MKKDDLFLNDIECYQKYRDFNYVYNKLDLLKEQDVECDPIGIKPANYPIIIEPILQLSNYYDEIKMNTEEEYNAFLENNDYHNGLFWYSETKGNQYITNVLLKKGNVVFSDTFIIKKDDDYISYYKHISDYILNEYIIETIKILLPKYTGAICIRQVDDVILELHLSWWSKSFIFKQNSDFISCIPIKLERKNPIINKINDEIAYVPFRKDIEDENDYTDELKKYVYTYNISFKNNEKNSNLEHICTFIIKTENLNTVLELRASMGLI